MLLPLTACATTAWAAREKALGRPIATELAPIHVAQAEVLPEHGPEVAVSLRVATTPHNLISQDFRTFQSGRYSQDTAQRAATKWLVAGALSASVVGLVASLAAGEEDASGELQPNTGVGLVSFGVVALPFLAGAGIQVSAPLLPARRRDVSREHRSWTEDGAPYHTAGLTVELTMPGTMELLSSVMTDASGGATTSFPLPAGDSVNITVAGAPPRSLDLRLAPAWQTAREEQVRTAAATGTPADAASSRALVATAETTRPAMWTAYCIGFASGWSEQPLALRTAEFQGDPTETSCRSVWLDLDRGWAAELLPAAARGEPWSEDVRPLLQLPDPSLRPEIEALRHCMALRSAENPATTLATIDALLVDASDTAASCLVPLRRAALVAVEKLEAERAREAAACESGTRQLAAVMPTLTSMKYAEQVGSGLRRTRDSMVGRMRTMVGSGGPTWEDEQWVQCVTYALSSADDMYRGIYQMNRGGYAAEWVAEGRFERNQEGLLEAIALPDATCGPFVRSGLGSAALGPIDRYLAAAKVVDEHCP